MPKYRVMNQREKIHYNYNKKTRRKFLNINQVKELIRDCKKLENQYISLTTLCTILKKTRQNINYHIRMGYLQYSQKKPIPIYLESVHVKDVFDYIYDYYRWDKKLNKLVFYSPGTERRNQYLAKLNK